MENFMVCFKFVFHHHHFFKIYLFILLLGPSDVIGFLIHLPTQKDSNHQNGSTTTSYPPTSLPPINFGGTTSYPPNSHSSMIDQVPLTATSSIPQSNKPQVSRGSRIEFFKNGHPLGIAFQDIFEGCYYPAASFYMGGAATFNFGPVFKFPPNPALHARPFCELEQLLPAAPRTHLSTEFMGILDLPPGGTTTPSPTLQRINSNPMPPALMSNLLPPGTLLPQTSMLPPSHHHQQQTILQHTTSLPPTSLMGSPPPLPPPSSVLPPIAFAGDSLSNMDSFQQKLNSVERNVVVHSNSSTELDLMDKNIMPDMIGMDNVQ